ncbi:MAG: hypothetical protein WHX52_23235 [Anaerolineae bacterium]
MRVDSNAPLYLSGDHLGSTSLTPSSAGSKVAELRYHPWAGTRFSSGTTPTRYQFTGQCNDAATYPTFGLHFYTYDCGLVRGAFPRMAFHRCNDRPSRSVPGAYFPAAQHGKCAPERARRKAAGSRAP